MINLIIAVLWEQYVQHDQIDKSINVSIIQDDDNLINDDEFDDTEENTYKLANNVKLGNPNTFRKIISFI